jgi:hypothetical protein
METEEGFGTDMMGVKSLGFVRVYLALTTLYLSYLLKWHANSRELYFKNARR